MIRQFFVKFRVYSRFFPEEMHGNSDSLAGTEWLLALFVSECFVV